MTRSSRRKLCGVLAAALCAAAGVAAADSSAFTDDLLFALSGRSMPDVTDFDATTPGPLASGESVGPLTFSYDGSAYTLAVSEEFGTVSPSRALGSTSEDGAFVGGDSLSITIDRSVQALGLYVVVGETAVPPAFFTLTSSSLAAAQSGGRKLFDIADGSVYFVGLVDTDGFDSATISASGVEDLVFNIDDVVLFDRAVVPEAAASLQAAAALVALALCRRSRRQRIR